MLAGRRPLSITWSRAPESRAAPPKASAAPGTAAPPRCDGAARDRAPAWRAPRAHRARATAPRSHGNTAKRKSSKTEQRAPADVQRRSDRHFGGGQLRGESMLFGDLRVAPARRTIEFEDQRAFAAPHLIHPVLITVEREKPAISLESERGSRVEHHVGRQPCEWHHGVDMVFVYHSQPKTLNKNGNECMTQKGTILVTGGAGYIGSHTVLQLRARGGKAVVLDNLYTGCRQAVLDTPLVEGSVGDRELVLRVLREHGVDTVMHFAAHTIVPESVSDPPSSTTATTRAPRATCSTCLRRERREALRVLLDRRGLRHPRRRVCRRGHADRADQSLRHLEAHVRMDAARPRRTRPPCATWPSATSTSRARLPGPHRPGHQARHAAGESGRARRRWANDRMYRSLEPTTPRRTARACATTSTSRISPPPTWTRSRTSRTAASPPPSTADMATATACARSSRASNGSPPAQLVVKEEPRRAGDPPVLVARAEQGALPPRLEAPPRRPRHHRPARARLGKKAAELALVTPEGASGKTANQ